MERVPSFGKYDGVFELKYRVGEELVDVAIADGPNFAAADIQGQKPGPGGVHALYAQFFANVAGVSVGRSVIDLHVVHAYSQLIDQTRADGPCPVENTVLYGCVVEAVEEQLERVGGRIVLETL